MRPLEGMRVVAVEQYGAGPYGTMFLADLGAEVIKIENAETGGDPARHVGPHMLGAADSQYFQAWNLSKRSVALDIKSPDGRRQFQALVQGADAVVNNLRGNLPGKLGIDYAGLQAVNPAVVCLHISAYGRDNERASWPGYDYLMQAEVGLMSLTGEPDGPPSRVGASMIDTMTGMTGVIGLLSAVLRARQTGIGCDVDTCLFDVAMHQLSYSAMWYLNEGDASRRLARSSHLSLVPVQTFPTADGWIFVMCMTEKFWQLFCEGIGRPDLPEDPRFAGFTARRENQAALTAVLDAVLRQAPTAHWLKILGGLLPVAPVKDLAEALDSDFVRAKGMVQSIPHPAKSAMKVLANPLKIDGVRPTQSACAPLGADNAALLGRQVPA
ncbi:CaiB/BaiF CoA transferase family protein [Plastoroseomonas hellenica]|uniref:CaiB/BaiF CoA transferase family protein n=1 Tax=Plastoroseomonas hellenica TaxID=2687306 RepID=UPI001BAD38C8|nr:CoA transferase [Plastoroseomonas hellenica]MBR0641859.1 CoA transferase [Plastoroseomonas hellenica]